MGIKKIARCKIDPKVLPWGFSNSLRKISTSGLVAFYDMDHINNNKLIDSFNHYDMGINGASFINGYKNYAMTFDGTNVFRSAIPLGNDYAISFRIRQLVKPINTVTELAVCNEGNFAFGYFGAANTFILKSGVAGRTCQTGTFQWGDFWNHILINYADNIPSIYINNQEPGYSTDNYWSDVDGMYFGGTFIGNFYHGDLDHFRLYNKTLQLSERENLFNEE